MKLKFVLHSLCLISLGQLLLSCLYQDLPELPVYKDAAIENNGINFEHRYLDPIKVSGGQPVVQVKTLTTTSVIKLKKDTGAATDSVIATISIPAPDPTISFSSAERSKISLRSLVCYLNVSTAATVAPVGDAPRLGTIGDYSVPREYMITAADGTSNKWTVKVNPLPLINQWEGSYTESGTLRRYNSLPPTQDDLIAELYLLTVNANTIRAQAGKSVFNNAGILYDIRINADNSVTILPVAGAAVTIGPSAGEPSSYDPVTKTFDLHYEYTTSALREFDIKLVLKP